MMLCVSFLVVFVQKRECDVMRVPFLLFSFSVANAIVGKDEINDDINQF